MLIEYCTLGAYFAVLLVLGFAFSKMTRNMSDFVRGGAQATWWLAGMSIVMSGISAFTFTGNASAAFLGGPTLLIIYLANCLAYLLGWLFLAAWFRQTRAYTIADLIRWRFGTAVEQFSVYTGLFLGPLAASIQLWALAAFASSGFGFPLIPTIVVIGAVVICYSTSGGRWAVMAADFVQGTVVLSITLIVAVLALRAVGGGAAFFEYFHDPRFVDDFRFLKSAGQFDGDRFTLKWVVVVFFMTIYQQISLITAGRYLTVKDGREARRASLFAMVLMAAGSLIWFIPPMVARFLYGDEILAQSIEDPSTSSYAFIAMKLLPNGLTGILIAAMFAATMSSMDTGLNSQVGIIVRNLIPRLRSGLGIEKELSPGAEMKICRSSTLLLGVLIIGMSVLFAKQKEFILFDAYLMIGSIIGIPLGFPLVIGLWIKRLPFWSYFAIFGACLIPSLISFYDAQFNDSPWTIQDRAAWIFAAGTAASLVCLFFYKKTGAAQRGKIDQFFKTMHTPVDFNKEIGEATDKAQARLVGRSTVLLGAGMLLLLFLPNPPGGKFWVVAMAGMVSLVGAVLCFCGRDQS